MPAQQHRERPESRTLQLHVALRSEVNAKFRHFGTCSQPTCFIKKLFINSCGPRSVSKMFWGYAERRKTFFWLGAAVLVLLWLCTLQKRVFVAIWDIVLKCNSSDVCEWCSCNLCLLRYLRKGRCDHFLTLPMAWALGWVTGDVSN